MHLSLILGGTPKGPATEHPAICEPVTSVDCKSKNSWMTSCEVAASGVVVDDIDYNDAVSSTATNLVITIASNFLIELFK